MAVLYKIAETSDRRQKKKNVNILFNLSKRINLNSYQCIERCN